MKALGQSFYIVVNLFCLLFSIPIFLLIFKLVTDFWEKPVSEWGGIENWELFYKKILQEKWFNLLIIHCAWN